MLGGEGGKGAWGFMGLGFHGCANEAKGSLSAPLAHCDFLLAELVGNCNRGS